MIEYADIKLLSRSEIDTEKWDQCISEAPNGLIYGYSFYLDHMARHWDALVLNNYEAVMPLTWNRKWGIKYLYQPPLTPQLGIFSGEAISEKMIGSFLEQINRRFKFAEIFFNYKNPHPSFRPHDNYILPLNTAYSQLRSGYKKDLEQNLKRAPVTVLSYHNAVDLKEALSIHQHQYGNRTPHVKAADYIRFENLCLQLQEKGQAILRAVSGDQQEILAVALLLQSNNRLYLLETSTSNKGRKMQATHFLLDSLVKEFSARDLILDFVGSDIPGIAHFYKNFGASNQPYFFYRLNKLPWPLKLFKQSLDAFPAAG